MSFGFRPGIRDAQNVTSEIHRVLVTTGLGTHTVRCARNASRNAQVFADVVTEAYENVSAAAIGRLDWDGSGDLTAILRVLGDRGHDADALIGARRWAVRQALGLRDGARQAARGSRASRRLVRLAVRLLPVADQARYAEELQADLWELREGSRRHQWAYAIRVLLHAPLLRHELRRPVPVRERVR